MTNTHVCPVCGYPGLFEPARASDGGGSYEYCSSCGFQFGVTDDDRGFSDAVWRSLWIADGMKWWDLDEPAPPGWNPRAQLRNIGIEEA